MPFGLHSASATFQRVLDRVIGPEMSPHAFAYHDDIIVIVRPLEEHKANLECLAIVWAIRKIKPYLEGYHFKVVIGHMALNWLNSIESPSGRIARWALELQQYDFKMAYRKGQLNGVADALSRQPLPETLRGIKETSAAEASAACSWILEMREKIRTKPQKYPDYLMEGNTLYRNIPHRAGSEDVATLKMCVPKALRETVLKENHDSPAAGHVGSRKTIARLAARYYWPGMHRDTQADVRGCETCIRFKPNQMQMAGKMLTQVPGSSDPCHVRSTATKCCWY